LSGTTHHIRRLALDAHVPSLDDAFALRTRLETLANRTLPAIAARVADSLIPPGLHLRLDRLELDLGRMPGSGLETQAAAMFESALTEAVQNALLGVQATPGGPAARHLTAEAASLADFETYLRTGQRPYWQPGQNFGPTDWFADLAASQPAALVALLRRLGSEHHALTRLLLAGAIAPPGRAQRLAPGGAGRAAGQCRGRRRGRSRRP
jgi:hypothetical protein